MRWQVGAIFFHAFFASPLLPLQLPIPWQVSACFGEGPSLSLRFLLLPSEAMFGPFRHGSTLSTRAHPAPVRSENRALPAVELPGNEPGRFHRPQFWEPATPHRERIPQTARHRGYGDLQSLSRRTGGTIKLINGEIPITDGVAIAGPGNIKVDGQHLSRIFNINIDLLSVSPISGNVAMSKLTLQNGRALGGNGGGIYVDYVGKLTLTNVRIQGCQSIDTQESGGEGGGIDVEMGDLVVINSVITGNTATANSETYSFGRGGGINVCSCATLSIQNSTISNNHADQLGAGINLEGEGSIQRSTLSGNICGGEGGGMAFDSTGTLVMTNCTLAKNQANSGGALYAIGFSIGQVTIQNSTIAQNTATTSVGGVFNVFGAMNLKNTIVAGNKEGTAFVDLRNDDGLLNVRYCIVQSPGDLGTVTIIHSLFGLGINVRLGPLAFNGGPTQTMALLPGSAAINAGDPNFQPPPSTDQRGPGFAAGLVRAARH